MKGDLPIVLTQIYHLAIFAMLRTLFCDSQRRERNPENYNMWGVVTANPAMISIGKESGTANGYHQLPKLDKKPLVSLSNKIHFYKLPMDSSSHTIPLANISEIVFTRVHG
jgi:hypothetical protein